MMKLLIICVGALTLSGCITAESSHERWEQLQAQIATREDQQCRSYGAQAGSAVYVNCRSQLAAARMSAPGPVTCTRLGNTTTCS
jgi:hypothetical protein